MNLNTTDYSLSHQRTGDYEIALRYRNTEVPFVIEGDPNVARTVERWNVPHYLEHYWAMHAKVQNLVIVVHLPIGPKMVLIIIYIPWIIVIIVVITTVRSGRHQ